MEDGEQMGEPSLRSGTIQRGWAPAIKGGEGDIFLNEEGFFDGNVVCCKFAARNFYEYFYYKHIKNENRED